MKKYYSPTFQITIFQLKKQDILTASLFETFASYDDGNLDDGSNLDVLEW